MTVTLHGLNDNRNIVTKSCKDHDQARLRVTTDVAAQDPVDVRLTDAGPGGISADEGDDVWGAICSRLVPSKFCKLIFVTDEEEFRLL
jgi:hypothetical protein